ncbi:uncharacterized protein TrAtP1_002466 [Trichoderma atroviride]|uniref:uncharacterized protein n=1 Tax=Hypocrea atroviridis TaxID=63577 RepID=UPI00331EDDA9|nr:hypothetical protein TrAtP1_002466 [Trichoderma atroviride]
MAHNPTRALTQLSPEGSPTVFDIFLVGFSSDGSQKETKPEFNEAVSKDLAFDEIRPKDWTRIVPQIIPEAGVYDFALFQERQDPEVQTLEGAGVAALSQLWKKRFICEAADLDTEARLLLDCIKDRCEKRHVLLAGCGLGGLVLKQAIIIANRNPRYYDAASVVKQLVFVATPHTAPNLDAWEEIVSHGLDAAEIMIRGRKTQIITDLAISIQKSSFTFHCFASRYNIQNLPHSTTIFQNDDAEECSKPDISSFLLYADEVQTPLHKSDKVSENDLRRYVSSPELLKPECTENAEHDLESMSDSDFLDFLQQLAPSKRIFHENSAIQLFQPDVELELYEEHLSRLELLKTFRQGAVNITGPPGHGKTTLLKLLVQRLKHQYSKAITIDFFLESFDASSRTSNQTLRNVIHQILSQRPYLFQKIRLLYIQQNKSRTWTNDILWDIFQRLVRHSSGWKIIVSINNFKNWSSELQSVFAKLDKILASSAAQYTVLTTGRGESSGLSHEPDEIVDLAVGAEDSRKKFLKAKLKVLIRKNPSLTACKKDILQAASLFEGSYSHTERCLKQLSRNFTLSSPDAIAVTLETCAKAEDDISLEQIECLLQGDSHVLNWSINVVSWVMHSARPLRIQELAVAAALGVGDKSLADLDRRISRSMEHDIDRYLDVLIRADSQVAHIYSAATKIFLAEKLQKHSPTKGFKLITHAQLAIMCIVYISHAISENWDMCKARLDWQSNKFQSDQSELEFLSYAVRYWPSHYHRHYDQGGSKPTVTGQEGDESKELEDAITKFLGNTNLRQKWYQLFSSKLQPTSDSDSPKEDEEKLEEKSNQKITSLEIASELGLTDTVKRIVMSDKEFSKSEPSILSSALALSVRNKHSKIISMLLKDNVPLSSAFIEAAYTNNIQAMRSLIAHGVELKKEDHLGSLALRKAASAESLDAVKLLLSEDIAITEADIDGRSTIHAVAIGGLVEMLKIISSQAGFDINARDREQKTALILAVQFDHVKLVRELCLKNADVTLADSQGKTALQYAVSKDIDITKVLLEYNASSVAGDKKGQTALNLACKLGSLEIVEAMVNSLEDPTLLDLVHNDQAAKRTPLHIAAEFGSATIVELFLGKGANYKLRDASGNTAMQLSASAGHLDVFKILLQHYWSHRDDFGLENLGPAGDGATSKNVEEQGENSSAMADIIECNELLCCAVRYGQLIVIRYLLNFMDSFHLRILIERSTLDENLLNIAASKGYTEIVRILLPRFDPNVKNAKAQTPLHVAVSNKHRDVIRFLLESGADPNVPDSDRKTPLHTAAKKRLYEIVKDLLRSGGDVNVRTILKETALHLAVEFPDIVLLLIDANADMCAKDYNEATPLHLAARANNTATIKLLLQSKADLDAVDENGETPLHYAIDSKRLEALRELWDAGPQLSRESYREERAPLLKASETKSFDLVRIILGKDLLGNSGGTNDVPDYDNIGTRSSKEMTLLDVNAVTSDYRTALLIAVTEQQLDIVKALLKLNADLTLRDSSNRTPLLIAASLGNAEIFEVLLEQGADLDSQDEEGKTALHLALEAGNLALTKRLIELFKDKSLLDVQDSSGKTSLYQAAYSGMKLVIELLLEAGADVNIRSKAGKLPLHEGTDNHDITLLLAEAKSDLNAEDEDGWTPLMLCVYWEHLDAIEVLLERDQNFQHRDKRGRTLLHIAVDCANAGVLQRCLKLGSIDIDAKDNAGKTALHTAVDCSWRSALQNMSSLIDRGAAIATVDNEGNTPLWTTIKSTNVEKWSMLVSKGAKVDKEKIKGQTTLMNIINISETRMSEWLLAQISDSGGCIWTTEEILEALSYIAVSSLDNDTLENKQTRAGLLLDQINMTTINAEQAFMALRYYFEMNLVEMNLVEKIPNATHLLEKTSKTKDNDMWTMDHLRYHMAKAYSSYRDMPPAKKPDGKTRLPSALLASVLPATESIDTKLWEVTAISVTSKTTDNERRSFRADHPFPIRGEGRAYFEAEASALEDQQHPIYFVIGLCGEFVHLGSSYPGIGFYPSIGFHGDDGRIFTEGLQTTEQRTGPFSQGVKIGCGIDWNEESIFFTRNGEIIDQDVHDLLEALPCCYCLQLHKRYY